MRLYPGVVWNQSFPIQGFAGAEEIAAKSREEDQ
jgi:hypothetical protein